jgi:hypothetical protein
MRPKVLIGRSAVVLALAAALPGGAEASTARIRITPSSGTPATRFSVRFTAPDSSGRVASFKREYVLSASGPNGARGCVGGGSWTAPNVKAHARVRMTLNPKPRGGKWCIGSFRGTIEEIQTPVCPKGELCPAFVLLVRTVGHFRYHVRASVTPTDTTAPHFGGLESAFACTPGPQRPGQTTPFTLSWKPATDNVTPGAKIVYDVFESSSHGAERYSKPSWTSDPGATGFKTPGLASHGSFYFVVRARDQAGNEDQNTVERRGSDPCY